MSATELLAEFREKGSDRAFGELVGLYTNFVYSVAKRRLGNVSLAQEVTQIVFIRLAKTAPKLHHDAELGGWLHRTAVHVSIDLWRSEFRRRLREQHAVTMQAECPDIAPWSELAPVLDEALNEMKDTDRQAILLRFFEQKSMRDLGAVFGISEDAAKMRINRAIERLRDQLGARGVTCSAIALGPLLAERSVEAAPVHFASELAALKFPLPAAVGAGAGMLGFLAGIFTTKFAYGLAVLLVAGAAAAFLSSQIHYATHRAEDARKLQSAELGSARNQPGSGSGTRRGDLTDESREPNPLKLLQAVASARRRITSGTMDIKLATEHAALARRETNDLRIGAAFDGDRLRFDQVGREYRYALPGDRDEPLKERIEREQLDNEAAVRAGLIQGFEAHDVMATDGANLWQYRETDGTPESTTIDELGRTSRSTFDPRCLGLRTLLSPFSTVERCLGYGGAKSVKLVGTEFVEGAAAWHVQVHSRFDETLDFWIEINHPDRVLKHANGRDTAVSSFDRSPPGSPIPSEVTTVEYRNGSPFLKRRFVQSNVRLNVAVDPESFTLAGLGMAIGTPVNDNRIHRSIGYWNGSGLSDNLPSKAPGTETSPPPTRGELLELLENDPASQKALDAAVSILLNTPDGPDVDQAAEVILRDHLQNTNLVRLCEQLERVRHRCSTNLLEALLKSNPSVEVRATACFTLATLFKDAANYGQNKSATLEAEKLFERVLTEFANAIPTGRRLAELAAPELSELRRLTVGKPAPGFEGEDLDARRIRLSDYRGKVVVVTFWSTTTVDRLDEHRKLFERIAGERFAYIGINCDQTAAKAKATAKEHRIDWPIIWDGNGRPISTDWNVHSWPSVFVLDGKGVIRCREARGRKLADAVDALLRE